MKQILQNIRTGQTEVAEVPVPSIAEGLILVETRKTLISAGTERMLVDFGEAGWLEKARLQPDKVRLALAKARSDGIRPTLESISNKLDQPVALGYSNVGRVLSVGRGVDGVAVGDRVVSNGNHAEIVCVPKNLSARVPDGVSDDQAVFTVIAAIGLQGIRLVRPSIGECVVVTGLGLIGLLTVQMLRGNGCRVLGIDFDERRLALARQFGAETVSAGSSSDAVRSAAKFSRGRGVDAVIITASTKSNEPVSQAAKMCRKRGKIVLVGVTGLELSRADFYEKELSFQVSCSYGPGRYDPAYEQHGNDYPVGFVRWTEQRNFEAVLDLMEVGKLDVAPLISHRHSIEEAVKAYRTLVDDPASLGILLEFTPEKSTRERRRTIDLQQPAVDSGVDVQVGVIGAGNYSGQVLMPALRKSGASIRAVVSDRGVSAAHYGRKFAAARFGTLTDAIINDPDINLAVIATRHDSHARYVVAGLDAGKSVFVEKPLCLTMEELEEIERAAMDSAQFLMVGFNRRFSPLIREIAFCLSTANGPASFVMTVNAGAIPPDHWTRDPKIGGGRIIGEACHFIDLLRYLAGHPIVRSDILAIRTSDTTGPAAESSVITLKFGDGSVGSIQYLTNGHRGFPKERLEVFVDGKVLRLDNFRRLDGWGWKNFSSRRLWSQNKGQAECIRATVDAVARQGPSPVPLRELLEVAKISIELANSVR